MKPVQVSLVTFFIVRKSYIVKIGILIKRIMLKKFFIVIIMLWVGSTLGSDCEALKVEELKVDDSEFSTVSKKELGINEVTYIGEREGFKVEVVKDYYSYECFVMTKGTLRTPGQEESIEIYRKLEKLFNDAKIPNLEVIPEE